MPKRVPILYLLWKQAVATRLVKEKVTQGLVLQNWGISERQKGYV